MVILDRESGAEWVDAISAAKQAGDWAETSSMVSALDRMISQGHTDTYEGLAEIVDGLHRLNVAVPAGIAAAHDALNLVTRAERPSLTRRARLIIIGGAAVAAAAYVYHRYRRTGKRADELEAIRSLLAGDSAVSLEEVTPQRRPSAKERSKVMERNKKLQAQKRAAETARDAAAADATRARADNDRLRAENARLASNATAGDERDAESERLRTEVDRLSAEVARRSASTDAATVHALRSSLRSVRSENDSALAAKAVLEATVQSLRRDRSALEATVYSLRRDAADQNHAELMATAQLRNREARLEQAHERLRTETRTLNAVAAERDRIVDERDVQIERLRTDKASLVAERDSLRAERDALEESARLVPAPSAGDLAALPDDALSTFAAEAAALSHSLVKEEARRAATLTTTSECVVCQGRRSR